MLPHVALGMQRMMNLKSRRWRYGDLPLVKGEMEHEKSDRRQVGPGPMYFCGSGFREQSRAVQGGGMNRRHSLAILASLLLLGLTAGSQSGTLFGKPSALDRAKAGKALWEEKCRTEAGEKIYRKVENVEGILLLKVRPQAGPREWADPNWPGAAFAREARTDEYIKTFLGYEEAFGPDGKPRPITSKYRGYINTTPKNGEKEHPGYRYVDVIDAKDGKRYRYTGRWEEPWQYDKSYLKGYVKFFLDKTPAPDPAPRYGVTYEDHVIPEDRALGLASSTVTVRDLQTKEVLGEMVRYAWSVPATAANPSPWLTAYTCPGHAESANTTIRMFVDQVLIPKRGN